MLTKRVKLLILICSLLLGLELGIALGNHIGYRRGQIDAINGEIHYRLERQADNSMDWVSCGGVCGGERN